MLLKFQTELSTLSEELTSITVFPSIKGLKDEWMVDDDYFKTVNSLQFLFKINRRKRT